MIFLQNWGISWKDELSQEEVLIACRISNQLCQLRRKEEIEVDGSKGPFKL